MKKLITKFGLFQLILLVSLLGIGVAMAFAGKNPLMAAAAGIPFMAFGSTKLRGPWELAKTMKYKHSSATTADTVYLLGGRPMLAINTAGANADNVFIYGGTIEYASETGVAWVAGDTLYWDNGNSRFTKTSTSNTKCGIAAEDKASAAATGLVELIPIV